MGNGRSALRAHEGEAVVHSPAGREKEAAALRRCAALDDAWPGFVDAFVGTVHAQGPAASPPPPGARGIPPAVRPAVRPAVERLVAIGDLHGDYDKTRAALRLGGLIDASDRWAGGATVAVQVGDQLDRGGDEVRILFLLERLKREAAASGGELIVLNGNHETMNIAGRFRYSTREGQADFARWQRWQRVGASLKGACGLPAGACATVPPPKRKEAVPDEALPRAAALCPGCPLARRFLAAQPTVVQVGSTLFAHGGLLAEHAALGLDKLNATTAAWVSGSAPGPMPPFLAGPRAVVWARHYSHPDPVRNDCTALAAALAATGAARVVVGHTIQAPAGINAACGGAAVRVDVGMSAGCGGAAPQVLELLNDGAEAYTLRYGANGAPLRERVRAAGEAGRHHAGDAARNESRQRDVDAEALRA